MSDKIVMMVWLGRNILDLHINRLSGDIPKTFHRSFEKVNILTGNLFQCDNEGESLPKKDPEYDSYTCGSKTLDDSAYINVGLIVCVMTTLLIMFIYRRYDVTEYADPSYVKTTI
jgi:hypothetical protein